MEILPVIKLMEQDLEYIDNESEEEVVKQSNNSESEEEEEVEKIIPKVEPKQIIPEENIFEDKKPIKKKRELSEAQKEHLKKGREKALAVRRAKAEERKKMKELENKEIELVKKAKQKRVQKLEEEVSDKPIEQKNIKTNFDINPELIKKIQQEAIEGYDKIRKERKAVKKKQIEEQQRNMVHANTINNALNPVRPAKYGESGFFDHLF